MCSMVSVLDRNRVGNKTAIGHSSDKLVIVTEQTG